MILEHHDAHVGLYIGLRQKVRWNQGVPVCYDCQKARMTPSGATMIAAPLWTAFDSSGTPRRVCGPCYRIAYPPQSRIETLPPTSPQERSDGARERMAEAGRSDPGPGSK